MTRPTTEELKTSLEQLVETYNQAIQTQQIKVEENQEEFDDPIPF